MLRSRLLAAALAAGLSVLVAAPAAAQVSGLPFAPPESGLVGPVPGLTPIGLTGRAGGDEFGVAVANAGDVNGDGYDDLVVGAPNHDAVGTNAGRAYLYLGGPRMTSEPAVVFTGQSAGDALGTSVAGAGDVNGDGYADVIVGAPLNDVAGPDAGRAYVYLGGPAMDAAADVILAGAVAGDAFGQSVAGGGDLNGDGFADVAVGAPLNDAPAADRGRVYVYFGGALMDSVADVVPRGQSGGDQFGFAVAAAGDVDGDGYDDLVVGAFGNDAAGADAGRAYVVLGGAPMDNGVDVVMTGAAAGDQFGTSVGGGGDVNGDGYDDVIVGAPYNRAGGVDAGTAYVFFGGAPMNNGSDLSLIGQAPGDLFGLAASMVGDVDGDGYDDLAVGAAYHDAGGSNAGRVAIYLGGATPGTGIRAILSGRGASDLLGRAVGGGGDHDGDGRADVIAGAPGYDASRGRVAVAGVHLSGFGFPDAFTNGAAGSDEFGFSVAGAGDVNGDGYDDLLVGAYRNDAGGADAGRAYLIFGGPNADMVPDLSLTGQAAGDLFGWSVAGAGDVNGDGYDDLIVGAPFHTTGGSEAGRAYIYYGGPGLDTVPDVLITGVAGDRLGNAVAGAGDVNGDGYDDVVIGRPFSDNGGTDSGSIGVYYGGNPMNNVQDAAINGSGAGALLGWSVAAAGDVNGDGFADVIAGAPGSSVNGASSGSVSILLGQPAGIRFGSGGMVGESAGDELGRSVSGAGDVNGDGLDDVIVGAPRFGTGDGGRAYLQLSGHTPTVVVLDARDGGNFGRSVAGVGDLNGDGYADVAVGAPLAGSVDTGLVDVFFGGAVVDAQPDVKIDGVPSSTELLGRSVAGAGDVNGDGAPDLLVGAPGNDQPSFNAGRAYLYLSTYPAAAPRLAAVRDVPDDQGGVVTAEWTRSTYDGEGDGRVTAYVVERSRADGPPAWEPVATVGASRNLRYSAVVPTYGVPAEGTSVPTRVRVTAVTASDGELFRSGVVTGSSVDNIAPPAPLSPTASPSDAGVAVSWTAPEAPDLAGFAVYRAATAGVTPSDETRVATLDAVTSWTDTGAGPGVWFYVVTARDANGNEGAPSPEASTATTAGEGTDLPTAFGLSAPAPNPSRGASVVRVALPSASAVGVTVYDAQGRRVGEAARASLPAGWHDVPVGGGLPPGVYVVRMEAGTFRATQRLVMVR